VKKLVS
jgi:hypothetical protein